MNDITKTDAKLGKEVNDFLTSKGIQTPISEWIINGDKDKRIEIIKNKFTDIMNVLGLNLNDDSLAKTPERIAKMYVNELFSGLRYDTFPKITTVENKMHYDEMLIVKNIKVNTVCEHHFVTIWGNAFIGYIPKDRVIGLSKFNRVVEYFCRRPQIQERLTEQIYWALNYILKTDDIAVVINAEHFCVKSRGVEDINSFTTTSKLGGAFYNQASTRREFMNLINGGV